MTGRSRILLNTAAIEVWPAHLVRARGNSVARAVSHATHVLRRKRDGRFVAAVSADRVHPLSPGWRREPGFDAAIAAVADARHRRRETDLPLARIAQRLEALGLDAGYAERTGLELVAEPSRLAHAGADRYGRPLWLRSAASRAWRRMHQAALHDGVVLEAISGYRSHDYQLGIFERKLARGQRIDRILTVNAAPGYSEHHSGRAMDISAPGEPAAEESFERTPAFEWLRDNAAGHGFVMSYPRDNAHGIVYEPWHWCHRD